MPYPVDAPTNKHDLTSPRLPHPSNRLKDTIGFENTASIFQALSAPVPTELKRLCSVYSFPDAPSPPLSRALIIIGVADVSLSVVRKLVGDEEEIPSCLQPCTFSVKRADGAQRRANLAEKDIINSQAFADLMRRFHREGVVAILSQDKYQRFGILKPSQELISSDGDYESQDFYGLAYVGNVEEVKAYLTQGIAPVVKAPPKESSGLWQPEQQQQQEESSGLWKPPGADDNSGDLWVPPGGSTGGDSAFSWQPPGGDDSAAFSSNVADFSSAVSADPWSKNNVVNGGNKRKREGDNDDNEGGGGDGSDEFHTDKGAAAADAFYSKLTRSLDTRADSRIYHMRAFNGWVKATQIQELDPKTKGSGKKMDGPMRVLDLACGKGGDLGKWVLHPRGVSNYVGIDVARGSLRDAAIRARNMRNKLNTCTFTVADLGADVPGRLKSPKHKHMQKLLTWSLQNESLNESHPPHFKMVRGGGISLDDKFDVVSIQFAIHYMMSSRKRARRFFQTVSELLEVGGNLIATTIDARVVLDHMMNLGVDLFFDSPGADKQEIVVQAGKGACKIRFEPEIAKRIFSNGDSDPLNKDMFGLEYSFTLVEGSDHAAGVGDAVNLPEWLTPIPVLKALAEEVGLELEYALNFHEFYALRGDPSKNAAAHSSLYNMKVLNRNGSISEDEWSISRLYAAIKFLKVRESTNVIEDSEDEVSDGEEDPPEIDPAVKVKLLPIAMMKAKKATGVDEWNSLSATEKQERIEEQLRELATAKS